MAERKGEKQKQGRNELVHYELALVPVPEVAGETTVWDETSGTPEDVTDTVVSGASTIQNNVLITPGISALEPEHTYRVECQYEDGNNNLLEVWFEIVGER